MEYPNLALLTRDDMLAALAACDIGAVYRLLSDAGLTPGRIARLTGQSRSEVRMIRKGRQVRDGHVLRRIADGLGIPRRTMGLISRADCLGELAFLPSRLAMSDVRSVRELTDKLRAVARHFGGRFSAFVDLAELYTPLMEVPAPEAVKTQVAAALAEMHAETGFWCYDGGLDGTGYFMSALSLATAAGDVYELVNALWHAGLTMVRSGHPNDALTLFHRGRLHLSGYALGTVTPMTVPADDPRLPILTARLVRSSASAYAVLGDADQAIRYLAEANDGWAPHDAFEHASADIVTAGIHLDLGQLEDAERFAASAVRACDEGGYRRSHILAETLLAEVHIRTGEPQGLTLARHAIDEMSTLDSVALRQERLIPLAAALETRPGTDTRELARRARKITAIRI